MCHTEQCKEEYSSYLNYISSIKQKYPEYCKFCKSWGGEYYKYDPSPYGISLSPGYFDEFEPCPVCLAKGLCPRCKKELNPLVYEDDETGEEIDMEFSELSEEDYDRLICGNCGWTKQTGGLEEPPECDCFNRIANYSW